MSSITMTPKFVGTDDVFVTVECGTSGVAGFLTPEVVGQLALAEIANYTVRPFEVIDVDGFVDEEPVFKVHCSFKK